MTDCLFTYMFAFCLSALVIGVHVIKCDRTDTCDENLLEGTFELLEDIAVSTMPLGCEAEISAVTLSIFLTYHSFPFPFRCVPHPRHPSLSTHLMKYLSLHPRLRTGSADTILRAIEELTCKNAAMNRGGDTFIFKPKLLIEGDFLILASKYDAFSSFYSFVLNLSLSLVFLCSTVRFFTAYSNAFICPMSTQIFFALVMAV